MKLQFLKYIIFGGVGVVVDYFIFLLLINQGVFYQTANAGGYLSGTVVSFLLNRKLTFHILDKAFYRFIVFIGVAFLGYLLSMVLLFVFVESVSLDAKSAKLLTLPIIAIFQFTINRKITFS